MGLGNYEIMLVILSLKKKSNKVGKSSSVKLGYEDLCLLTSMLFAKLKSNLLLYSIYMQHMLHRNKLGISKHSFRVNKIKMFI